jgi:hypothetical protein
MYVLLQKAVAKKQLKLCKYIVFLLIYNYLIQYNFTIVMYRRKFIGSIFINTNSIRT